MKKQIDRDRPTMKTGNVWQSPQSTSWWIDIPSHAPNRASGAGETAPKDRPKPWETLRTRPKETHSSMGDPITNPEVARDPKGATGAYEDPVGPEARAATRGRRGPDNPGNVTILSTR